MLNNMHSVLQTRHSVFRMRTFLFIVLFTFQEVLYSTKWSTEDTTAEKIRFLWSAPEPGAPRVQRVLEELSSGGPGPIQYSQVGAESPGLSLSVDKANLPLTAGPDESTSPEWTLLHMQERARNIHGLVIFNHLNPWAKSVVWKMTRWWFWNLAAYQHHQGSLFIKQILRVHPQKCWLGRHSRLRF